MSELICFIGSHITAKRLPLVKELIASIAQQTATCPIYWSWSADDNCQPVFRELIAETKCIQALFVKEKSSQFQHYRNIITQLPKSTVPRYIMFSDDDDLWAEDRIQVMANGLTNVLRVHGEVFSRISFLTYAELYPDGKTYIKEYSSKLASPNCLNNSDSSNYTCNLNVDHWATIVPFHLLLEFYELVPDWIVANPYCDIRFCEYIQTYKVGKITETVMARNNTPLYFYRIHPASICEVLLKTRHTKTESLKERLNGKFVSILSTCMQQDSDTVVSILCRHIELSAVKHYPKALVRAEIMIKAGPDIANGLVRECINKLFPAMQSWAKEIYNLTDEEVVFAKG